MRGDWISYNEAQSGHKLHISTLIPQRNAKWWDVWCKGKSGDTAGSCRRFVPLKTKLRRDESFVEWYKGMIGDFSPKEVHLPAAHTANALYRSVSKQLKFRRNVAPDFVWNKATSFLYSHFFPVMGQSRCMSMMEALDLMDLTKSSGAVFGADGLVSKADAFRGAFGAVFDGICDYFGGVRPPSLWTGFLKDELRPEQKVLDESSRLIWGASIDHATTSNMLFLDQNRKMIAFWGRCASMVGVTPFGGVWGEIFKNGTDNFSRSYDSDAEVWDGSMSLRHFETIREFRIDCLRPEWRDFATPAAHKIYEHLTGAYVVLPDGRIVHKEGGGNCSGASNTVYDNILGNFLNFACAVISQRPDIDYDEFNRDYMFWFYGDDAVVWTSDEQFSFIAAAHDTKEWFDLTLTSKQWEFTSHMDREFLSTGWFEHPKLGVQPRFNTLKFVSCMANGAKDQTRYESYVRAASYRMLTFLDPSVYAVFDGWCHYLLDNHYDELCEGMKLSQGENLLTSVRRVDPKVIMLDERALVELYTRREGGSGDTGMDPRTIDPFIDHEYGSE